MYSEREPQPVGLASKPFAPWLPFRRFSGDPRPGLSTGPHTCVGEVLERQAAGGSGQWPLGNVHLHLKTGCFSGRRAFPTFAGIQNGQNH